MSNKRNLIILSLTGLSVFLSSCAAPKIPTITYYQPRQKLLATDLSNCFYNKGSWQFKYGVLTRKGGGSIWTKKQFGDFVLNLQFKLEKGTNSGIFIRTADIKNPVQTGIEVQLLDSYGKTAPGKHDCGAIYDCLAPSKNMTKKPGQWNRMTITAKANQIKVVMNGQQIINMDLNQWTEPGKNPDGTKNKYKTAYKDMPRIGHIGFQDHGKPVWFRNIKIKPLDK